MNARSSAAEGDVVRKLAKGSLLSRLKTSRQPLKLAAVPRDHVQGDRARGSAILSGRFAVGSDAISLGDFDFATISCRASRGFAISRQPPRAKMEQGSLKPSPVAG